MGLVVGLQSIGKRTGETQGTLGKGQKRVKPPPIAPRVNPAGRHGSIQLPAIDEEVAEMLAQRLCFVHDLAFDADIAVYQDDSADVRTTGEGDLGPRFFLIVGIEIAGSAAIQNVRVGHPAVARQAHAVSGFRLFFLVGVLPSGGGEGDGSSLMPAKAGTPTAEGKRKCGHFCPAPAESRTND